MDSAWLFHEKCNVHVGKKNLSLLLINIISKFCDLHKKETLSNLNPTKDERRRVSAVVRWNVPIIELNILNMSATVPNTFKTLNPLIATFHRTTADEP
jgi:hypothetical protein